MVSRVSEERKIEDTFEHHALPKPPGNKQNPPYTNSRSSKTANFISNTCYYSLTGDGKTAKENSTKCDSKNVCIDAKTAQYIKQIIKNGRSISLRICPRFLPRRAQAGAECA